MTTENWIDLPTMQDVAKAQSEGWEIEIIRLGDFHWFAWDGKTWGSVWSYRGRPRQPVMKEVKMLCWLISGMLYWYVEKTTKYDNWIRQPNLDMIAKVPE